MDTSKLGHITAELMEEIADRYENGPVVIGDIMLIVEIKADPNAEESDFVGDFEDFAATIEDSSTDPRIWVQMGLLAAVVEGKRRWWDVEDRPDEDDDDAVD